MVMKLSCAYYLFVNVAHDGFIETKLRIYNEV